MPLDSDDPLRLDVFMSLWTKKNCGQVASCLSQGQGRSMRECGWYEYEVVWDELAEFVIEAKNPILVHGGIASIPHVIPELCRILERASIQYECEVYDEHQNLILESSSPGTHERSDS